METIKLVDFIRNNKNFLFTVKSRISYSKCKIKPIENIFDPIFETEIKLVKVTQNRGYLVFYSDNVLFLDLSNFSNLTDIENIIEHNDILYTLMKYPTTNGLVGLVLLEL